MSRVSRVAVDAIASIGLRLRLVTAHGAGCVAVFSVFLFGVAFSRGAAVDLERWIPRCRRVACA